MGPNPGRVALQRPRRPDVVQVPERARRSRPKYPRPSRGVSATRVSAEGPSRGVAATRVSAEGPSRGVARLHGISTSQPRRRRDPSAAYPRGEKYVRRQDSVNTCRSPLQSFAERQIASVRVSHAASHGKRRLNSGRQRSASTSASLAILRAPRPQHANAQNAGASTSRSARRHAALGAPGSSSRGAAGVRAPFASLEDASSSPYEPTSSPSYRYSFILARAGPPRRTAARRRERGSPCVRTRWTAHDGGAARLFFCSVSDTESCTELSLLLYQHSREEEHAPLTWSRSSDAARRLLLGDRFWRRAGILAARGPRGRRAADGAAAAQRGAARGRRGLARRLDGERPATGAGLGRPRPRPVTRRAFLLKRRRGSTPPFVRVRRASRSESAAEIRVESEAAGPRPPSNAELL